MSDEDPLLKWSRTENEETTQALVYESYVSILARGGQVESFATWLLAGTAATVGLMVAHVAEVSEALGRSGVQWALYSLVASMLFGLASKAVIVFLPTDPIRFRDTDDRLKSVMAKHRETRSKLKTTAEQSGKPVPVDISIEQVLREFARPLPALWRFFFWRVVIKWIGNRERIGHLHIALRGFFWQIQMCFLQVAAAFVALVSVAIHVVGT